MATGNSTAGSGPLLLEAAKRRLPHGSVADGDAETIELRGTTRQPHCSRPGPGLRNSRSYCCPRGGGGTVAGTDTVTRGPSGAARSVLNACAAPAHGNRNGRGGLTAGSPASGIPSSRSIGLTPSSTSRIASRLWSTRCLRGGRRGARARDMLGMVAFVLRDLATNPGANMASVREMLFAGGHQRPATRGALMRSQKSSAGQCSTSAISGRMAGEQARRPELRPPRAGTRRLNTFRLRRRSPTETRLCSR